MSAFRGEVPVWHLYVPKLFTVLRRGYGVHDLRHDLVAGLTVAIVALPLAMALAIASGSTPEKGLHTAIIAGILISLLGGSRVQIGGPTAAFIPIVFNVIEKFGYGGLVLCTLLAGLMLIAAGLLRIGTLMKYMPQPVITGFTAGIAVSIFLSQVRDFLGLHMGAVPAEFFARLSAYAQNVQSFNLDAVMIAFGSVIMIVLLRRWQPSFYTYPWRLLGRGLAQFQRNCLISRFLTFRSSAQESYSPAPLQSPFLPASNRFSPPSWPTA
jgi:SulP family sulfate permease